MSLAASAPVSPLPRDDRSGELGDHPRRNAVESEIDIPLVDVAVVVLRGEGRVLLVYNPQWSSFTLPMTKRRRWQDPRVPPANREEAWVEAAARAVGECLGTTFTQPPGLLADLAEFHQGDRDGVWKRYHFQVFQLPLLTGQQHATGAVTEWLTPAEILDPERRPISPTARSLVQELMGRGLLS
jgi:hypothetical protein